MLDGSKGDGIVVERGMRCKCCLVKKADESCEEFLADGVARAS